MDKFTTLTATACPLDLANVDTDQLIPARFMKRSRAEGYGGYLLHDLRFDESGNKHGNFALDQPRFAGAKVIVARGNFGTGSSREAAVYALWDFGIRCVIAPSFGDIFSSNATKNGLLTAVVAEAEAENLLKQLVAANTPWISVNLEQKLIAANDLHIAFDVDPVRRLQLLNGWDDIDFTFHRRAEIEAFRTRLEAAQPWAMLPKA